MAGDVLLLGVTSAPHLVAYTDDTLAQLRDIESLPGGAPGASVNAIAVSPSGSLIAVGLSSGAYLAVYDGATWAKITLTGGNPTGVVYGCAFSPDGTKLAVAHANSPYLTVYDTTTWAKVTLTGGNPTGQGAGCDWSADGTKLACSHSTTPYLTVYNVADWSKVTLTGGNPASTGRGCKFSPDGAKLATITSSNAESLVVYNVSDWSKIAIPGGPPGINLYGLAWTPDGTKLAVANSGSSLWVYTVADWSNVTQGLGTSNTVSAMCYNGDGTRLGVGYSGSTNFAVYSTATWASQSITYSASNGFCRSVLFSGLPVRDLTTGVNAVLDVDGLPAQSRVVRAYARATGALVAETTTDAAGKFALKCATSQAMQMVILDDDAGDTFNDLIVGRVTPAVPL